MKDIIAFAVAASAVFGEESLTLRDAVRQALADHPSREASFAALRAAEARRESARAGYLPRVTVSEAFLTSNQPVFAFGSLLNQRRFAPENFAIDALNHPGAIVNSQAQLAAEQTIWDFGRTGIGVQSAAIGKSIAEEDVKLAAQRRIALVARAYHAVTLAEQSRRVAEAAVQSAEAGLRRAEAVRDAGMSTDADVLSMRVHLAAMRELEIRRRHEARIALATLNESVGAALDTDRRLATPLTPASGAPSDVGERPELRQARLARDLSESQRLASGKAQLPSIVARGAFEANRGRFFTRAGVNWLFAAGIHWNLFDASARGRVKEAEAGVAAARARERETASRVLLEQRQAQARLVSADEQLAVASAAVGEAEESARITRNRYEAGLARIDELLRNELSVVEAQMRRLMAVYSQRMAAVEAELAAGALTEDSRVLE
jgi:outer membrane protein